MARATAAEKRAADKASADEARRIEIGLRVQKRITWIASFKDGDLLKRYSGEGMTPTDELMARTIYEVASARQDAENAMRSLSERAAGAVTSIAKREQPWNSRIDPRDANEAMVKWETRREAAKAMCYALGYYTRKLDDQATGFALECEAAKRINVRMSVVAMTPSETNRFVVTVDGSDEERWTRPNLAEAWEVAGEILKSLTEQMWDLENAAVSAEEGAK